MRDPTEPAPEEWFFPYPFLSLRSLSDYGDRSPPQLPEENAIQYHPVAPEGGEIVEPYECPVCHLLTRYRPCQVCRALRDLRNRG